MDIYQQAMYIYCAIPRDDYEIPLITLENIEWGLGHKFLYVHTGLLQFGLNPLVRPGLNISPMYCIIDSLHCKFLDALVGGFSTPLHNGVVWSLVVPHFVVSLTSPRILTLLYAYNK
jgi:hypothetical protein